MNKAWLAAALTAVALLAWLRLPALDGSLACAEPKTPRYRIPARRRPPIPQQPPARADPGHLVLAR